MIIDKKEYNNLLKELDTYKCVAEALQFENDNIIKENKELKEEINRLKNSRSNGGRKKKLSDLEVESIRMYRLQGISIRELAKMFNCSVGTIHNILKSERSF